MPGARRSQRPRQLLLPTLLVLMLLGAACGGDVGIGSGETSVSSPSEAATTPIRPPDAQTPTSATQPSATGTILGQATDESSGKPLAEVYIVVGYKGIQRATITDADGRYTVHGVPAGEPAAILGFHEHNYRYHNSRYDADFVPRLEPGQTITYDFTARQLADPAGQPIVSDPVINTGTARPGDRVQFELTVTGGEGGLSDEVFASSPRLGRIAWLQAAGGDRFRGELTIPSDTAPGDYPFAFFAASNKCYDPERFPTRVLHVESA